MRRQKPRLAHSKSRSQKTQVITALPATSSAPASPIPKKMCHAPFLPPLHAAVLVSLDKTNLFGYKYIINILGGAMKKFQINTTQELKKA
jgi:hypothetical protein